MQLKLHCRHDVAEDPKVVRFVAVQPRRISPMPLNYGGQEFQYVQPREVTKAVGKVTQKWKTLEIGFGLCTEAEPGPFRRAHAQRARKA